MTELDKKQISPSLDLQPAVDRIKWEDLITFLDNKTKHEANVSEKIASWDIKGTYTVVLVAIISASILAWHGVLEGQALAGFLGTAIGYLLASKGHDD